jgi:hypothetical protein
MSIEIVGATGLGEIKFSSQSPTWFIADFVKAHD